VEEGTGEPSEAAEVAAERQQAWGVSPSWVERIVALPSLIRLGIAIGLVAIVGGLDLASGSELSLSIFYLIPVAFAGVALGRLAGVLVAVLAAAVWGSLDITTGRVYVVGWAPYWNSAVRLGFYLIVNELLFEARRAHLRERGLSRTDAVTGIANARVFQEHANRVIAESHRHMRPFTIAYIDLDRFKQVNDRLGHSEGDRVLRTVASVIERSVRKVDTAARLGGDEFGILMPETGVEEARVSLERTAAAVAQVAGSRWAVGATVGAVTFTEPPESVDWAVSQADALMYRGKAGKRGRVLQATWPE
jgi:diguanylate cyclase (GGDEF)-like protein